MVPPVEVGGGIDDDPADRGVHGILHMAGGLEALELLGSHEKVLDREGAVLAGRDVEREAGSCDPFGDGELDRGVLVHLADAEELVVDIGSLESETGDDLLHEVRGGEGFDLVVHVGAGGIAARRSGEGREVTHHGGLRILVHDNLFRTAVGLRRLIQVESGDEEGGEDAGDVPPLVVPDEGPEVGKLEGLLLLAVEAVHDRKVVLILFCHSLTCSHGRC